MSYRFVALFVLHSGYNVPVHLILHDPQSAAFYEPYTQPRNYVDPLGIHSVVYLGTKAQWQEFLQSDTNQNKTAFQNVKYLQCLGILDEPQLTCEFQVASEWKDGCNVMLTVTNHSDKAVNGWKVSFTTEDEISSIWSAQIVSHENGTYVIRNMDWNGTIQSGESVSFGFIMTKNSSLFEASTDIIVTGK